MSAGEVPPYGDLAALSVLARTRRDDEPVAAEARVDPADPAYRLRAAIENVLGAELAAADVFVPPSVRGRLARAVMTVLDRELPPLPDGRLASPRRDRLELAVMRERRAAGQTWREIAAALGMSSPQVAHARYQRLTTREADGARR